MTEDWRLPCDEQIFERCMMATYDIYLPDFSGKARALRLFRIDFETNDDCVHGYISNILTKPGYKQVDQTYLMAQQVIRELLAKEANPQNPTFTMRLKNAPDSILPLELLRQLVDYHGVPFAEALPIVQSRFAAPDTDIAWECYSVDLFI